MVSAPAPHSTAPANRAELSAGFREFLVSTFEQAENRVRLEVESQIAMHVAQAVERSSALVKVAVQRELAEALNQACRRFRESASESPDAVYGALLDAVAPRCGRAAVFSIAGGNVRGLESRGLEPSELAARLREVEFPLGSAAAFQAATQSLDPVVSAASAGEISAANVSVFAHPSDDRVYLFPVVVRQQVVACLYVPGGSGEVEITVLELLTGMAAASLEAASVPEPAAEAPVQAPEPLLSISPAAPPAPLQPGEVRVPHWPALPEVDQQAHACAQRLARVLVAEIRLYRPDAVRSGRARHDIYRVLREDIDRARENYRRTCFPGCPSMVDYLHLELVQSLANNEVRVLGSSYPGPLRPVAEP